MSSDSAITQWIRGLKQGDEAAAERIWRHYGPRLVRSARKGLVWTQGRVSDEEDMAQAAFLSLWRGAVAGRFPALDDRAGLWALLRMIVQRKVIDYLQYERRQKRGGGMVRGQAARQHRGKECPASVEQIPGPGLPPDQAAQVREACQRLLDILGDEQLRRVAILKMDGVANKEIGKLLSCSRATVARKLALIRQIWLPHWRETSEAKRSTQNVFP